MPKSITGQDLNSELKTQVEDAKSEMKATKQSGSSSATMLSGFRGASPDPLPANFGKTPQLNDEGEIVKEAKVTARAVNSPQSSSQLENIQEAVKTPTVRASGKH